MKFRRFINADLQPSFVDDEIAVVGINTARSLTWKNGRINVRQIEQCCERLAGARASAARIVVTHHPFDLPLAARDEPVVGRATMAMSRLIDCGSRSSSQGISTSAIPVAALRGTRPQGT